MACQVAGEAVDSPSTIDHRRPQDRGALCNSTDTDPRSTVTAAVVRSTDADRSGSELLPDDGFCVNDHVGDQRPQGVMLSLMRPEGRRIDCCPHSLVASLFTETRRQPFTRVEMVLLEQSRANEVRV